MENLLKKNICPLEAKKRLMSLNSKFNKLIIIIKKNIILIFEKALKINDCLLPKNLFLHYFLL